MKNRRPLADILRARRAVEDRQGILFFLARAAVSYAVGFAQDQGKITRANGSTVFLDNPTRWAFSRPPRLSVDDGREEKMLIEGWRAGNRNLSEIVDRDVEEFLRERARETILSKRIAAEESAASGFEISEREMRMLTPNEMATAEPVEQKTLTTQDDESDPD